MNTKPNTVVFCLSFLEIEWALSLVANKNCLVVTTRPEIKKIFQKFFNSSVVLFSKENFYLKDIFNPFRKANHIKSVVKSLEENINFECQNIQEIYISSVIAAEICWKTISELSLNHKFTLHYSLEFSISREYLKDVSFFDFKSKILNLLRAKIFSLPLVFKTNGKYIYTIIDGDRWMKDKIVWRKFNVDEDVIRSVISQVIHLQREGKFLLYLCPPNSVDLSPDSEMLVFQMIYDLCCENDISLLVKAHPQYPPVVENYNNLFPSITIVDSAIPAKMLMRYSVGVFSYFTFGLVEASMLGVRSVSLIDLLSPPSKEVLNYKNYLLEKQDVSNQILFPSHIDELKEIFSKI